MAGPGAPKDPTKKYGSFYIMQGKEIAGGVQPDGSGIQYIYLNEVRLVTLAKITGNIQDEHILKQLQSAEGFRKMVAGIGVVVESEDKGLETDFVFQMYGKTDASYSGTTIRRHMRADGMEEVLWLDDYEWSADDDVPGQIRFEFEKAGALASADVRLYLREGYTVPEPEERHPVDTASDAYKNLIKRSLLHTGNNHRLKKLLEKAKKGEEVTLAFLGGSITQGAGAVPLHTKCYAYRTYEMFCEKYDANTRFIKGGVGGTPSELGMVRLERDILRDGKEKPDLVVVEFAVNDASDETKGVCYESLVRRILALPWHPAVILLFSVFADDWNLQDRLAPIGQRYDLPMVSIKDAVTKQFYKNPGEGRILGKSQFFYDYYHPSNVGHQIMADSLMYLLAVTDRQETQEEMQCPRQKKPVYGDTFQDIHLLDRRTNMGKASIDCGSFTETDCELQKVEMDDDPVPVGQFPHNWMHTEGDEPFRMRITCRALVLVFKDSNESRAGRAQILVDGREALCADPHVNGWIHCNPKIIICHTGNPVSSSEEHGSQDAWMDVAGETTSREHLVEIRMAPGEEDKEFTILGFGFVE